MRNAAAMRLLRLSSRTGILLLLFASANLTHRAHAQSEPCAQRAIPESHFFCQNETTATMKATLIVSGGFSGIGGKWELDLSSSDAQKSIAPAEIETLKKLIAAARAAGLFGKDFTASATGGPAAADARLFEFYANDENITWSDALSARDEKAAALLQSIRDWMMHNTARQPYQPSRKGSA